MKKLLALFGIVLLGVGLLAVIVAAINTDEWEAEKSARLRGNFASGVSALGQADQQNTALFDSMAGNADKQYQRFHDQRIAVLGISTVCGVVSLLGGTVLLIAGITLKRKIKVATSAIPPKL